MSRKSAAELGLPFDVSGRSPGCHDQETGGLVQSRLVCAYFGGSYVFLDISAEGFSPFVNDGEYGPLQGHGFYEYPLSILLHQGVERNVIHPDVAELCVRVNAPDLDEAHGLRLVGGSELIVAVADRGRELGRCSLGRGGQRKCCQGKAENQEAFPMRDGHVTGFLRNFFRRGYFFRELGAG